MFSDGEYFSGKGVGRVSVSPKSGINIDVFVTHTISEGKYYSMIFLLLRLVIKTNRK